MFPQEEWTRYGVFGYRRRWRWNANAAGWYLAIVLSLGLWAVLTYAAIGLFS